MKRFLRKLMLFIFPLPLFFTVLGFGMWFYIRGNTKKPFPDNINFFIIGDSHTQTGLNDSIIENSYNISHSSQHYFFTYNVIKYLTNLNKNINTIILGASFHNFSKNYDNVLFDAARASKEYYKYFPILDAKSISFILFRNPESFIKSTLELSTDLNKNTYDFLGFMGKEYHSTNTILSDSAVRKTVLRHYYNNDLEIQMFSKLQTNYFYKIVNFCNSKNLNLIILTPPLHYSYINKIPDTFMQYFNHVISNNVFYLNHYDYHDIYLNDNNYGDGDHLNYFGSVELSHMIMDSIIHFK